MERRFWAKILGQLFIQAYLCNSTCVITVFQKWIFKRICSSVQKSTVQFPSFSSLAICHLLGSWICAERHHSRTQHNTLQNGLFTPIICTLSTTLCTYMYFCIKHILTYIFLKELHSLFMRSSFAQATDFTLCFLWLELSFS